MRANLLCSLFAIAGAMNLPSPSLRRDRFYAHLTNEDRELPFTSHGSYSRIETDGRRHVIDHSVDPIPEFDTIAPDDPEESTWEEVAIVGDKGRNSDSLPTGDRMILPMEATPWTRDDPVVPHAETPEGRQTDRNMERYDPRSGSNIRELHPGMRSDLRNDYERGAPGIPEPRSTEKLPFGYVSPVAKIPVPPGYKIRYDD
ncbi:uncharacterized protein LOC125500409 [Athalia rosae]|uniref:uncharacterized protein LOC125500409 n=1 Tax=Athalia rosae TaxID=37344 RepID=UPI002033F30A|nr:uncharacterized protein LOC125500409 [Athalia rosae]